MKSTTLLAIQILGLIHISLQDSVSTADACAKIGKYYVQGCSGLTAQLLGRPWKEANAYRLGAAIGANGQYSGVSPGELVGFPGHVAVYIGQNSCPYMFVDVPGPKKYARGLTRGYGSQTVYKVYY